MVREFDLQLNGHEFDSQRWCYQVTALGKLLTPMCLCHKEEIWYRQKLGCKQAHQAHHAMH